MIRNHLRTNFARTLRQLLLASSAVGYPPSTLSNLLLPRRSQGLRAKIREVSSECALAWVKRIGAGRFPLSRPFDRYYAAWAKRSG